MFNKKLLKTVAVASLVGLSTVNLIGCKEKVEEVKIIKEQEVEQKETIKIDDMEVTMAPLQPSLQLELPTEPETKEAPEVKEEIHEEPQEPLNNTGVEETPHPQPTQAPPQQQAKTGTDKNGHPYLQPGTQYTFGADGFPIEAPTDIYKNTVIDPNTGVEYWYSSTDNKWRSSESVGELIERDHAIRDGKMDSQGNTNLITMSDEDKAQIAAGIARAMGGE